MTLLTHVGNITVEDDGTSVSLIGQYRENEYLEFNTAETEQLVEALITWLEGRGVRRFKVV